jgi:hypothetical protein
MGIPMATGMAITKMKKSQNKNLERRVDVSNPSFFIAQSY